MRNNEMKHFYLICLVLTLLFGLSHVMALPYAYKPINNHQLLMIDSTTGKVKATFPVAGLPYVYVPTGNQEVSIVNTTTGNVETIIPMDITAPLPEGAEPIVEPIDNAISGYYLPLTKGKINVHLINHNKTLVLDNKTTKVRAILYRMEPILAWDAIVADFFLLRIFITGNGSGTIIAPQDSYSGGECLEIYCEERYTVVINETDFKIGFDMVRASQSLYRQGENCLGNACQEGNLLKDTIIITATPNADSILTKSDCVEKSFEKKDGFYYSVADCTIGFDLDYPQLSSHTIDAKVNLTETTAIFVGGISTENNSPQKEVIHNLSTNLAIRGIITVPSEHLEQTKTDILVVAKHTLENGQKTFFMRKGDTIEIWDGNIAHLAAFQKDVFLAKRQLVEIYNGKLPEGRWEIYFGYRLQNNGMIIFNSEPLKVRVTP